MVAVIWSAAFPDDPLGLALLGRGPLEVQLMRARLPDESGYVVNSGVRIHYEVHGTGQPTILLLPTWAIVDSRHWKMQVPFLARDYRVITFDPRGNGRSDRPRNPAAYADTVFASDAAAVLDATGTERALLAAFCSGFPWALLFAAAYPQRVTGIVAIAPTLPIPPADPWEQGGHSFDDVLDATDGWAKENRHYWRRDWRGYVEFFMSQITTEPHSTKPYDDLVEWGMQTDAETMLCDADAPQQVADEHEAIRLCRSLACPVLVIGGEQDKIVPPERTRRIAELTSAELLVIEGGGHAPHVRYPVAVNHAIRNFVDGMVHRQRKQAVWHTMHSRPRRALWISSPIGLGHVQRDLAIARALRERVPDLEIHWWAQPPVTEALAGAGEIIHPASSDLVSESAHWESESAQHDLPAFYAFRRMDEILCANYLLFDDVVRDTSYDVWVGDECWEIDYFLHENPERKIAPYVFMTDVIGFLPTDPGDPREAELCADYNADSIEKRERFPRLRDLSMFIGSFDELPDLSFGPGLPGIRSWSSRWFTSVPYVLPFNPAAYRDRARLRGRLGYPQHQPLLVAAVGGTAAGVSLLELTCDAFARLRKQVPDARMLLVTGPRIDPRLLPDIEGMDKRGYLPDLFEHLACADAAIVQGGLSTTMELVATGRPFIYFPLRRHWEQQHFVTHRLNHYRAGLRMDYTTTTADGLATTMRAALAEVGTRPGYRKVPRGGAARAAARIATLLAAQ
jgi:pimeloyl-ACP methyl ester carboxylesterase/UDP:flavonoid glycosyltransferase YjiC (YdhE family)